MTHSMIHSIFNAWYPTKLKFSTNENLSHQGILIMNASTKYEVNLSNPFLWKCTETKSVSANRTNRLMDIAISISSSNPVGKKKWTGAQNQIRLAILLTDIQIHILLCVVQMINFGARYWEMTLNVIHSYSHWASISTLCSILTLINSLRPSDAIWRHRSWSTLAQVMACCLTAPTHYMNQCWLIISKIQLHSFDSNFTRDTSVIND